MGVPAQRVLSITSSCMWASTRTKRLSEEIGKALKSLCAELEAAVEDGGYSAAPDIGFADWADRWLGSLERKPSTVGSYRSTIVTRRTCSEASASAGSVPEDIARFNGILRERGCSPSTRAKHLRVLGACLQAAVFYRYADSNPVRELPPAQRPRPERKEAAYFENEELPRLFAHLQDEPYQNAVPGRAQDGDAAGRAARAPLGRRRPRAGGRARPSSYTGGTLGTPKNRERRDVDLISDVVELLDQVRCAVGAGLER